MSPKDAPKPKKRTAKKTPEAEELEGAEAEEPEEPGNPYRDEDGKPQLLDSIVCYADILGFSAMSQQAVDQGPEGGRRFLARLKEALDEAHEELKKDTAKLADSGAAAQIKVFTDNLVVACPIIGERDDKDALWEVCFAMSLYQASLAAQGFFLRGGIARGEAYLDQNLVFGEGLIAAYKLDQAGQPPRLVFCERLAKEVLPKMEAIPVYGQLLASDADGKSFVGYLHWLGAWLVNGNEGMPTLADHQKRILEGLEEHRYQPQVRVKYEWLARYHNAYCKGLERDLKDLKDNPSINQERLRKGSIAVQTQQINLENHLEVPQITPQEISDLPSLQKRP